MKDNLISYATIIAAKNGSSEAMNTILSHYAPQIEFYSRRTMIDEYGNLRSVIDPEIKDRIQAKIIERIINHFDPYRMPKGEVLEE